MKPFIFICLIFASVSFGYAQIDVPEQPQPALPQGEYGTQRVVDPEVKEDRVEVPSPDMPESLVNTLENDSLYEGWKGGKVYLEKNTNEYILHLTDENEGTKTYRFDNNGNPVNTPGADSKQFRK